MYDLYAISFSGAEETTPFTAITFTFGSTWAYTGEPTGKAGE